MNLIQGKKELINITWISLPEIARLTKWVNIKHLSQIFKTLTRSLDTLVEEAEQRMVPTTCCVSRPSGKPSKRGEAE